MKKYLIREIAQELGLSEQFVEECLRDLFKRIRQVFVSDTFRDIYLHGLGTFRCKPARLRYMINEFWCRLETKEPSEAYLNRYNSWVKAYFNKLNWKTYDRRTENRKKRMGEV